jgi:hypothetical protein
MMNTYIQAGERTEIQSSAAWVGGKSYKRQVSKLNFSERRISPVPCAF